MRVLHVAECIGGVDVFLRVLLKYSSCENVMILSQLYNIDEYKEIAHNIEVMHMEHKISIAAICEAKELRKKIKKYKPDIVYAHSSIAGAVARMACIGLGVKVVYNPHGWAFNMDGRNQKVYVALERIMSHFCDAIICISEAERESAMKKKICKNDKLHVIYNGIDIENYRNEEVEMPIPQGAFVVGMVGRICKQKAPDIFVEMASEVNKRIKNVFYVIVGDVLEGEEQDRKEIEELARQRGVNLYITGWVKNPMAFMAKFDIGCLLSRWEGFGLVIPEYMLAGIPIVATRVDAIPYLISDNINGLLVNKDDWKDASEKVIELYLNKQKQREMIENGLTTVKERFDAKRVASEYECLYEELVK